MIIHSQNVVTEQGIRDAYLEIENGKIVNLSEQRFDNTDVDYGNCCVMPGIFDTHNHGYDGWGPGFGRNDAENIRNYCRALASVGVTSIFPTCMQREEFASVIDAAEKNPVGAGIRGIHCEGPYLNRVGEKGIDMGHPDIHMEDVADFVEKGHGWLKLMAIAYELPHADEAVRYLTAHGVRASLAHTNATYEQAEEAFHHGVTVTTHTANVMTGIHQRNMGALGAALLDDGVFNEVICDGLHVRNEMLEIMFRVKNDAYHKFMMVSDNLPLAGFPAGRYVYADTVVNITEEGFALTDTGRLFGSAKPVLYGMKNLVMNMGLPLEKVSMMASLNPCQVYGMGDRKGSLRIGKDADFTVIDKDFNCLYTFNEGRCVYDHKRDTNLLNQEALETARG